jgi:AcrR family transcriptional regulator
VASLPNGKSDHNGHRSEGDKMSTSSSTSEGELLVGEVPRPVPSVVRTARAVEIVAAARRILEDEGPTALTMRRIADEMDIQAPSLYKHFSSKSAVEMALIEDALFDFGEVSHQVLHEPQSASRIASLLAAYRLYCLRHSNLYRLCTSGYLDRTSLPAGLEEWAGNPWYVVTGDSSLAQALWSFAHGMLILEMDERYPPASDLDLTWQAGATAFEMSVKQGALVDR